MNEYVSMRGGRARPIGWTAAMLVAASVGCNKPPLPSAEACPAYEARLCDAAGQESATCQAMKLSAAVLPAAACDAALKNVSESLKKVAAARRICEALADSICQSAGPTTPACATARSEAPMFPPERCRLMSEHLPEVVAELEQVAGATDPATASGGVSESSRSTSAVIR